MRYDVNVGPQGVSIDYHFCREIQLDLEIGEENGCFGTNQEHGYSFDEAKDVVIAHLEQQIIYWRDLTEEEWEPPNGSR